VNSPDKSPGEGRDSGATAPAVSRRTRSDAIKNRERLLVAAGRVFEEKGLEASVADVARAAGVGMGTLYRRFASKEALIEALVGEVLEATIAMAQEAAEWRDGTGLERFLEASGSYQAEHLGCLPKLWKTDHHLTATARDLVAGLLADAQAHGRIRADLTSTDIALVMWSMRGVLETSGANMPRARQRHLDLVIAGLRPTDGVLSHRALSQDEVDGILAKPYPASESSTSAKSTKCSEEKQ
jgi:AcrR family transcriptional regulator